MKFFKIEDKVRIQNPMELLDNEDLETDFKAWIEYYRNEILEVYNTKQVTEGDEEKTMYWLRSPKDKSESTEPFYSEELVLVNTSDWDE